MIKNLEIKNRWNGNVLYSSDLDAKIAGADYATQFGFVIKKAIKEHANLHGADLRNADLRYANLHGADLRNADLQYANLHGANLHGADLRYADLHGADLRYANLHGADLRYANLRYADLHGADLQGTNLQGTSNLKEAKDFNLALARTRILPDEGSIVGWKKCDKGVIVKLLIPAEAKRSHAFGRKCRAEYVDVLEVFGATEGVTTGYGPRTVYRAGERVKPVSFDPNWMEECAPGIHFFITREEAEAYV